MCVWVVFACGFILIYTYFGYPCVLFLCSRVLRRSPKTTVGTTKYPSVTLVVPVHNAATVVEGKLRNINQLEFSGELEVMFVLDGCTDATQEIIERFPEKKWNTTVFVKEVREGKERALAEAIPTIQTEVLVFSDADAEFAADAVTHLVEALLRPKVGVACGEERHVTKNQLGAGQGEGMFGKYENFVKRCQASFTSMTYVQGGVFAMWRDLYPKFIKPGCTQDGTIAFASRLAGKAVQHVPEAVSTEYYDISSKDDFSRRVRTVCRAFYSIVSCPQVLLPWKTGWFPFHLISHRLLRWFCIPVMILAFVATFGIEDSLWFYVCLIPQILFYVLAIIGAIHERTQTRWKLAYVCYYFMYMHLAAGLAVLKVCLGRRVSTWTPSAVRASK